MKFFYFLFLLNISFVAQANICTVILNGKEMKVADTLNSITDELLTLMNTANEEIFISVSGLGEPSLVAMLKKKASEHVKVLIIITDPENQTLGTVLTEEREAVLRDLLLAGVQIKSIPTWSIAKYNSEFSPEDHRKIVIIDQKRAYLGTANLSKRRPGFDLGMFYAENEAQKLRIFFLEDWARAGGAVPKNLFSEPVSNLASSDDDIQFLGFGDKNEIEHKVIEQILNAKVSITMVQHELSDPEVLESLSEAKKNNPNLIIKVLLGPSTKPRMYGRMMIKWPANVEARVLFKNNEIQIAQSPAEFVHAKAIVFDSKVVIMGSADMNERSFKGNLESNVLVKSSEIATVIEEAILARFNLGITAHKPSASEILASRIIDHVLKSGMALNGVIRQGVVGIERLNIAAGRKIFARQLRGTLCKVGFCLDANIVTGNKSELKENVQKVLIKYYPKNDLLIANKNSEFWHDGANIESSILVYAGGTRTRADFIQSGHMVNAPVSLYDTGMYTSNDVTTAVHYSIYKSTIRSTDDHGSVLMFEIPLSAIKDGSIRVIKDREGRGCHYYIIRDLKSVKLVGRVDL